VHAWEIKEIAVQSFEGREEPTINMFERILEPMDHGSEGGGLIAEAIAA
jgi:hypothetical protein